MISTVVKQTTTSISKFNQYFAIYNAIQIYSKNLTVIVFSVYCEDHNKKNKFVLNRIYNRLGFERHNLKHLPFYSRLHSPSILELPCFCPSTINEQAGYYY